MAIGTGTGAVREAGESDIRSDRCSPLSQKQKSITSIQVKNRIAQAIIGEAMVN